MSAYYQEFGPYLEVHRIEMMSHPDEAVLLECRNDLFRHVAAVHGIEPQTGEIALLEQELYRRDVEYQAWVEQRGRSGDIQAVVAMLVGIKGPRSVYGSLRDRLAAKQSGDEAPRANTRGRWLPSGALGQAGGFQNRGWSPAPLKRARGASAGWRHTLAAP